MVIFSALRPILFSSTNAIVKNGVIKRAMSEHRTLPYLPSKFQWNKFKDLLHFYLMLGAIPISLIVLGANIFVGPATLSEIPEDYVPKHYEYYRNPITRFLARYVYNPPQQDYEKYLHHIFEEEERVRMRKLETEIKQKIGERKDYQAFYYRPITGKYHRISKEASDYVESLRGD